MAADVPAPDAVPMPDAPPGPATDTAHQDVTSAARATGDTAGRRPVTRTLIAVGVVIMLAGVLFGYDQGVISGALDGIKKDFNVSTFLLEVITSWVTLGAMGGALVAGALADRLGRRLTILLASLLFTAGALIEALAPGAWVLVIGRLVVGFGVGVASVAAPLYAAEMAPARLRGRFVSLYQLAITIGIFVAYLVDYVLSHSSSWRAMLGVSAVPAILLVFAMWPLSDSPRWYVKAGRRAEAEQALRRVQGTEDVDADVDVIQASIDEDARSGATWGTVFAAQWRRPLLIGVMLAVLQQLTGINAIIYYANQIFAAAGFTSPDSQSLATLWAVGAVNVVATFVAVAWVDRFGRKPLLFIGTTGMGLSLVVVGAMFLKLSKVTPGSTAVGATTGEGLITLVALVVFIASFAFSLGPIVWTIINEIFPSHVRGKAVAVATAANWFAAWLVAQFFLTLVDVITTTGVFWVFAAFCGVTFWFVRRYVPETKGKSLEQIQSMWGDPAALAAAMAAE
jgi:sugar porter (SP) family MFS transporter